MTTPAEDMRTIEVLRFPLAVFQRAQEHADELLREFALIHVDQTEGESTSTVPRRLLELVDQLIAAYSTLTTEQELLRDSALERGDAEIDLVYQLPAVVRDATVALGALLDECDEYCRAGQSLLTLATPPESKAFRDWYLGEFVRQIDGLDPVPWPESEQARTLAAA